MTLTASGSEASVLKIWEVSSTSLLPSFQVPLWAVVLVPVRFPSMGQIDLFKNYLYSIKPCAEKSLKKQEEKFCELVDFVVPTDQRVKKRTESEKLDKYQDLVREQKKLWNMKVTDILIITIGTIWKRYCANKKSEEELRLQHRCE